MPDPDLEKGGGGGGHPPNFFWPFEPQFGLKIGVGGGGVGPLPGPFPGSATVTRLPLFYEW